MRRLLSAVIVVVILGTAGGLVVCAIPKIQDAAARSQCQNNLKQIGLGLHNYRDSYGTFPSATIPNEDLPCDKRLSWMVEILPFTTQIGLVIDRTKGWRDEENIIPKWHGTDGLPNPPAPLGNIKLFRCPADSTVSPPDAASLTNYVGISGVGANAAELPLEYPGAGFFGCERKIKPEDIKDGVANTIAVMARRSQISGRSRSEIRPVFQGLCHLTQLGLLRGVGVNCRIQYRLTQHLDHVTQRPFTVPVPQPCPQLCGFR